MELRPERALADTAAGQKEQRKVMRLVWGSLLLLVVLGTIGLTLLFAPVTPEVKARRMVWLPAGAKVSRADAYNWSGDFSIEFTVPAAKDPVAMVREVVSKNPLGGTVKFVGTTATEKTSTFDEQTVSFDRHTKTYSFERTAY